ncbi:unnamed protein product [Rotaria socialis]|uniref:Uncharacterized protein n=1 Tax=Rotaria socialis TaxID=392032 RepID=A0A817Q349_9BILA|nr:unnamed protein product [Rotaria socialis]CAF3485752.1 unnamed protein product [Rotaria socialis]
MANDGRPSVSNEKREVDYAKLWRDLQIDFHLEGLKFPDNKIYGRINIIPASSRKLIQKFVLVVNDEINRIDFEPHIEHLAASGFNTKKKHPWAYIEAIPNNSKWPEQVKKSNTCSFHFTGEVFALNPTIGFSLSDDKQNLKPNLTIKWYHIGDKVAQRYVICLDDLEVRHIRQKEIEDVFNISISGFECGDEHTLQLAARLNNRKETYRSDPLHFIVPNKELIGNDDVEFITVSDDLPPSNLPGNDYIYICIFIVISFCYMSNNVILVIVGINADEPVPDINHKYKENDNITILCKNHKKLLAKLTENINRRDNCTCCSQLPHKIFPGVEHYFENTKNRNSFSKDNRTISSKENTKEEEDDDDDDVITLNN